MELNRTSYEIQEKKISLYLSYNDIETEDILIRISNDISGNISNLKEYLNLPSEVKTNQYRVLVVIKTPYKMVNSSVILSEEEIFRNIFKDSNLRFSKVINNIFVPIPIIENISNTEYEGFDDIEGDGIYSYYNKVIFTKENLITYIVNNLLENKMDIVQDDHTNYSDNEQLCLKI